MTLIDDSIEQVKASILVALKTELTEAYPDELGDYKTSKGSIKSKVYWSDTVREQPKYPFVLLTPQKDIQNGSRDEIVYLRNSSNKYIKRTKTRSTLTFSIDVFDMGNEQNNKSSLKADTFAHKVARQLRKYFSGDEMLDWFSGNDYYGRQLGISVDGEISSNIDWVDTDTLFRYTFDISVYWIDVIDVETEPANGIHTDVYEEGISTKFTEFDIYKKTST